MAALSLAPMAMTFVLFAFYGCSPPAVREQVISRPRVLAWMHRAFAGSFVALGAKLAFTRNS